MLAKSRPGARASTTQHRRSLRPSTRRSAKSRGGRWRARRRLRQPSPNSVEYEVEFAPRAVGDLSRIGARSRSAFGPAVAAAVETFIRATIARLAVFPE